MQTSLKWKKCEISRAPRSWRLTILLHLHDLKESLVLHSSAGHHELLCPLLQQKELLTWLKADVKLMINRSPVILVSLSRSVSLSLTHAEKEQYLFPLLNRKLSTNRNQIRNCFRRVSICKFSIFHTYSSLLLLSFHYAIDVKNPHQIVFSFLNFLSF